MPRQYIVNSWVGACEYDEGDTYSGEQIGNRNQKSVEVPIRRSGDQWKSDIPTFVNGRPNIAAFAEPEQKPKVKKKKSVADSIDLAQRHFDRVEQMSIDLDEEYFAGEIDEERYQLLRYKLDERLIKAWKRLEKENAPFWQKEDEKFAESSLTFSMDEISFENNRKSCKSLGKTADKSLIDGEGWGRIALRDCKNDNVFLVGICAVIKLINKIKGEI